MQFAYRHCNNPAPRNNGRYCTGKRAIYRSCSVTPCPANGTLLPSVSSHHMSSVICILGLLWWLSGRESACLSRRHGFNSWVRKIPWRSKWQPTSVFLPGKSHGQRSLAGYRRWRHKRVRHDLATKQSVSNSKSLKPSSGQVTFYCSHLLPPLQSLMHLNEHHATTAAGPQWKLHPSCHCVHKDNLGQSCSLSSSQLCRS